MQINYLWLPSFLYKYLSLTVSDLVILHFFCYGITFQIKKYDNIVKCYQRGRYRQTLWSPITSSEVKKDGSGPLMVSVTLCTPG